MFAIACDHPDDLPDDLRQIGVPIVFHDETTYPYLLHWDPHAPLSLQSVYEPFQNVVIDWHVPEHPPTPQQARQGRSLLARAIGLKGGCSLSLLDVTAGLGYDAVMCALMGCDVRMCERSPVIAALLRDAWSRAPRYLQDKLSIVGKDALVYLEHAPAVDVIYVDPMYPVKKKKALPSKAMRMLRGLVGDDLDAVALCEFSRTKAKRVVVKRPRLAPPLMPSPDIVFTGKTVRFDVYCNVGPAL